MSFTVNTTVSKAKPASSPAKTEQSQAQCQCPDIRKWIGRREHAQPFGKDQFAKLDDFFAACGKPSCRSDIDFRELPKIGWTSKEADEALIETVLEMSDYLWPDTA